MLRILVKSWNISRWNGLVDSIDIEFKYSICFYSNCVNVTLKQKNKTKNCDVILWEIEAKNCERSMIDLYRIFASYFKQKKTWIFNLGFRTFDAETKEKKNLTKNWGETRNVANVKFSKFCFRFSACMRFAVSNGHNNIEFTFHFISSQFKYLKMKIFV